MEIDWNNLFATWYNWLGSLNAWLAEPIRSFSEGLGVPLVSAFLFGLLGTTAPCQISTNIGAMAFLARRPSERAATVRATLAYVGAKVIVYTAIGLLVLVAGRELLNAAGPYLEWPRKLVGPLMILLGLVVGGVIGVRLQVGQRLGSLLEQRVTAPPGARLHTPAPVRHTSPRRSPTAAQMAATVPLPAGVVSVGSSGSVEGTTPSRVPHTAAVSDAVVEVGDSTAPRAWPSFVLGVGFSLAFCPTLFVLFFGATLTIAARSAEGFAIPAVFALGTVVPLLGFVALALTGSRAAGRLRRGIRRANRPLRWAAAGLLVLLGLHDTLVYWFL